MKAKTITLFGGFHNATAINLRISESAYNALKSGEARLYDVLSPNQRKRADNHFCGIKDCTCGGCMRAEIDFQPTKKQQL